MGENDDKDDDDEEEEEEEHDDEPKCDHFSKKETLRLVEKHIEKSLFHFELEMGFNVLTNGDYEIYYKGLRFRGLFIFRILFEIHAQYFMWAMRRYFQSNSFG